MYNIATWCNGSTTDFDSLCIGSSPNVATKFNKMATPSLKSYFKPTPKRFRVLGDSLASASVMVSTYAIVNDMKSVAILVLASGWLGKFITNFFTDEPETTTDNQQL